MGEVSFERRVKRRRGHGGRGARATMVVVAGALALSACGGSVQVASGPVTLSYYNQPDSSPATQDAANACSAASGGAYTIHYIKLPSAADQQRQQLVRRLAAHDSSIDIMGLDVTWEPEFSQAGWIVPWTGAQAAQVTADTLPGPLHTAQWHGRLVAVPLNSNTELLWYRSDLVPNPPRTWGQMIADAEALAKAGKPHYIEIQGAQYEGLTVWFNSLVSSAGGSILNSSSTAPSMGAPALRAMQIMSQLAHSPAADPSLSVQMEDQNRLAMEAGTAAFEINYPFVYPSMKADKPSLFKVFKYTTYPAVSTALPVHSTIGGIDLAISSYSKHQALAKQAALCLRDKANQLEAAVVGGLPPTLTSIYQHPTAKFVAQYPFYKDILTQLTNASVRPKTPEYQAVSIYISHTLSPPSGIHPRANLASLTTQIRNALDQKGLIP